MTLPKVLPQSPSLPRAGTLPQYSLPSIPGFPLHLGAPTGGHLGFLFLLVADSLPGKGKSSPLAVLLQGHVDLIIHMACGRRSEAVHPDRPTLTYFVHSRKVAVDWL